MVYIVSKYYIIAKAIQSLIRESDSRISIRILSKLSDIKSDMPPDKAVICFIDEDIVNNTPGKVLLETFMECRATKILISHQQDIGSLPEYFNDFISWKEDKTHTLRKISSILSSFSDENGKDSDISEREQIILKHVALGLTNREIADKLNLSIHTVITHRKNITRKLGIKTVSGLTVYAILNNLVDIKDVE